MHVHPRSARHRSRIFDWSLAWLLISVQTTCAAQIAGPLVVSRNPNYFKDANGRVLILNGSQTWNTLQDWGSNGSLQTLDFNTFVKFLSAHGHNFTLLWTTEMPKFCGFPATASSPPDMTAGPLPWLRTGPGNATDGGLKFDLTKFNPSFFDRLRKRTEALNKAGIYAGDHSYWEIWKDAPQVNRNYAWKNFMSGNHVLFMDPYVVYYPRESRNLCVSPDNAICSAPDKRYDNFRDNLGYILKYSRKLNLASVTPNNSLSSTQYCLAQSSPVGAEYLVYAPSGGSFTVNLSAMSASRTLSVEWFNPSTGAAITGVPIPAGSSSQSFSPPFSGDAVLYLVDTKGHATSGVN